jgi:subtilisin family serine protease
VRRHRTTLAFAVIAALAVALPVQAGNPFATSTTTSGGYHTWDSDLINIENVSQTGAGVYVAVLDTGLVPNWSDYFPKARVATSLGTGFDQSVSFKAKNSDPCGVDIEVGALRQTTYIGSTGSTHGTHVTSTIIGYSYRSNTDAAQGFSLPAIQVRGIAPNATIIPVKVLADYQVPKLPKCTDPGVETGHVVFGTDAMVAAGINYVTHLKQTVLVGKSIVINMSLGDSVPSAAIEAAIDASIAAGVVVVASAGNEGEDGMGYPGAYAQVISAGAAGWTGEWLDDGASGNPPANTFRYRMWWLQNVKGDGLGTTGSLSALFPGSGDTTDATPPGDVYVTDFSSRELTGQDLDVVAPGSWVRGPFAGDPGYNHLPWWSHGIADLLSRNSGNFFYLGGTSMASPHVASVAALMLEEDPSLTASQVECMMEASALQLPGPATRQVWDPFNVGGAAFYPISWNDDASGSGLIQADAALAAAPCP